jgi:hypothetical protein
MDSLCASRNKTSTMVGSFHCRPITQTYNTMPIDARTNITYVADDSAGVDAGFCTLGINEAVCQSTSGPSERGA